MLPLEGAYSQGLDGLQRGKESLADGLQLVVIQGEQVEVLQVLKRVHSQAVDLVGVEEAASRREASDSLILLVPCGARAPPAGDRLQSPALSLQPQLLLLEGVCVCVWLLHPCGPRTSTHIWALVRQVAWTLCHTPRSPGALPVPVPSGEGWKCTAVLYFLLQNAELPGIAKTSLGTIVLTLVLTD